LYDRLEDKASISPFDVSRYAELREAVQQALQTLSLREADIIRYRSGINQEREYTLQEVGDKYSLTRERIRQLEDKAKRKLRKPLQPWNESSW